MMGESKGRIAALRRKIGEVAPCRAAARPGAQPCIPAGHGGMDAALGGGVMRGRLHEILAADAGDASSAAGFAAMLAHRAGGAILWLREDEAQRRGGRLYPPGLVQIGIDPARLVLAVLPDPPALLRAAADVARCPAVGVAVVELWRTPRVMDLTASRRLALAAEAAGVTVLLLRVEADAAPSAAQTRWAVRAAPSGALAGNAPGHSALDVEILRQRGRPAVGRWHVEWDRDQGCFRDHDGGWAALSGAVPAFPAGGQAEGRWRRRA